MAATTRTVAYSTQIVHIGSGASMAAGAMSASTDISTALVSSTNLGSYALCDVALKVSNTGSVSSASNTILLYRRDLDIDSTNDEPLPATATSNAWRNHLVGVFQIPPYSVASTTYQCLADIPLSPSCEFYIENTLNTGIGLGWTLKVTPKTDSYA